MAVAIRKQWLRFVDEYLIDLNGTQAANRAGYSPHTANEQACRLLKRPEIQALIAEKQHGRAVRTEITTDRVLLEIARLAFSDPRKAFDADGNLLPVQEWPNEVAAAISSIKITEQRIDGCPGFGVKSTLKEIKFWDKGKQLDLAARHLGMLNDKLDISGNVTIVASKLDELI